MSRASFVLQARPALQVMMPFVTLNCLGRVEGFASSLVLVKICCAATTLFFAKLVDYAKLGWTTLRKLFVKSLVAGSATCFVNSFFNCPQLFLRLTVRLVS